MPVFRVSPVDGDGKVKIVCCKPVLPIGVNIETSGNERDQKNVDGPQDFIQAVFGDVPIDFEPEEVDDVIHLQHVQRMQEPIGWPRVMWDWQNPY